MIIYDFEVFSYDWLICWLDTETRKLHHIINNKEQFEKMYNHYKNTVWIGYNSRNYDQWVSKAILCDFDPKEMNDWIIKKDRKGYEFSKLLNSFPILNYDCSVGFRSLKELEAFMGHDIRETSVPFDIDRKLTPKEIEETLKYCKHDVMETFHVFVETKQEWESHVGLIKEFNLPLAGISKTKAQLSAMILGAVKKPHDDEFDIIIPKTLHLDKYSFLIDHYLSWSKNSKNYEEISLECNVAGVPHTFGAGGAHGAIPHYFGEGIYVMADVDSYYPACMIEYDLLSRNVRDKKKFKTIRDERIRMKAAKDSRQQPRKIVLNGTFGASKDKYNNLYDPRQANNICIHCQLFIVDLIEKIEGKFELIQTNTDGILCKLEKIEDLEEFKRICKEWETRTGFTLGFDIYNKVIQRDVNNYILVDSEGHLKRKGAVVKKLSKLDNDLPIVNKAVVDYFVYNIPVEKTIMECDELIMFQKITKISRKYEYGIHNGKILNERVHRCFASNDPYDGVLYKKKIDKDTPDKTAGTPEHCFIYNDDVLNTPIPAKLDKQWYIDNAKEKISKFI